MLVYVLELADDCFYVGRANSDEAADARVEQHKNGKGAEWTRRHVVLREQGRLRNAKLTDEDATVVELAVMHGVDKVRGGAFCTPDLSEEDARMLRKLVDSALGACYQCHTTAHCASECPFTLSMAAARGGDWECPDCGNDVFARNKECPQCGKWRPKETKAAPVGKAGWKKGDWECPGCHDHQFSKNKTCRNCSTPKPAEQGAGGMKRARDEEEKPEVEQERKKEKKEPAAAPELKSGDWLCDKCQSHNYASRDKCFKFTCQKPRPRAEAEKIADCSVCLDRPVGIRLDPCGHLCACKGCSDTLEKCPICRADVTAKQAVFQ
jgi:hypothetical protein